MDLIHAFPEDSCFPHQVGNLDDVYQVVNEDEYSDIVRKRQEDDWVVDDGKSCVHDCEEQLSFRVVLEL